MIINHWGSLFTRLYGHAFPESYLCVDTEYTGGNEHKDLIVEIGHCLVEDRVPVDRLGVVLDWTRCPEIVPRAWLVDALRRAELMMANSGQKWRVTLEVMQREGIDPIKALTFYYDMFQAIRKRDLFFAAHNGFYADERMLKGAFEGFLTKDFRFGENQLFDTGAIFKASLALESHDTAIKSRKHLWTPTLSDRSLETYFRRIVYVPAKGLFWNLAAAIKHFKLDERYQLDMGHTHEADFDAYLVHLLMEEYRSRITQHNGDDALDPAGLDRIFSTEMAKRREEGEQKVQAAEQAEEAFERRQGEAPRRPRRRRGQRSL